MPSIASSKANMCTSRDLSQRKAGPWKRDWINERNKQHFMTGSSLRLAPVKSRQILVKNFFLCGFRLDISCNAWEFKARLANTTNVTWRIYVQRFPQTSQYCAYSESIYDKSVKFPLKVVGFSYRNFPGRRREGPGRAFWLQNGLAFESFKKADRFW